MRNSNAEQTAAWDGAAGEHRVRHAATIDAGARAQNAAFRAATGIMASDRVLDVGCGTGQSTRDAARAAVSGSVLGVDLSSLMLESARELSDADGLRNVTYEQADAQVHTFAPAGFDVVISRFGTMFFDDHLAAFSNLARALRPAGRLVMMVWQSRGNNEWANVVRDALGPVKETAMSASPFSLSDQATVTGILDAAGFGGIKFTDVQVPISYGSDVDTTYSFVRELRSTNDLLVTLDPLAAEHALERVYNSIAAHETEDGVLFDSRSWIVEATSAGRATSNLS
ncbi:MAG: methyltransferase [Amycolatopsis sp.]|uniref:class I SAM-dependent methyltransferase n=1 Tax=Amycolatopsis sp. TaxID=37632 RepID=UPI0026210399|nr:class I SAM-dependent methyltransferase [Amycolatopsis sp.]MCU1683380.1 methyltransferase [Amycolatopsis sp.]